MKRLFLIMFFTFCVTSLFAQNVSIPKDNLKNIFSFPSQFHLKNLNTSQSFSFSTIYNSQTKKSFYLSNFCNRFQYKFSSKMNLQLDLNAVKYGSFSSGKDSDNSGAKILPNFLLDYSPKSNLHFRISWESFPTTYFPNQKK